MVSFPPGRSSLSGTGVDRLFGVGRHLVIQREHVDTFAALNAFDDGSRVGGRRQADDEAKENADD